MGEGGGFSAKTEKCLKRDKRCHYNAKCQLSPKRTVERNTRLRKVILIISIRDLLFHIFNLKHLCILRSVLTWFSICFAKPTSTLQVKMCILMIKFFNFCAVAKTAFFCIRASSLRLHPCIMLMLSGPAQQELSELWCSSWFQLHQSVLQRSKQSNSWAFLSFQMWCFQG